MNRQKLFETIINVTGFTPLESDMDEIQNVCEEMFKKSQWIDINNEKPNNRQIVICYSIADLRNTTGIHKARFYKGDEYNKEGFISAEKVTHWMPLPTPPSASAKTEC